MDSLARRVAELEQENKELKRELAILNAKQDEKENGAEHGTELENDPLKILQYLKSILGFNVRVAGKSFILRSVYAFCESDTFEIEIQNNKLVLKNTDYLAEWNELFNTYILTGRSYCAFFAAVTLELFNRKTFG